MTTFPSHCTSQRLTPFGEDNQFTYMLTTKQPHHLIFFAGTISPLSHLQLTTILHHLLSQTGLCPSLYASYGFRIGAATTAVAVGLTPSLIKTLGRWNNNLYIAYVSCPQSVIAIIPQHLSTASVSADTSWNPDL